MSVIRLAGIGGVVAVALLALAGCDTGSAPLPGQPALPGPAACPRIYNPVCAGQGGAERTFPNACEARTAGYDVHYQGQCGAGSPPPYDNGGGYGYDNGGGYGDYGNGGGRPYGQPGANGSENSACPMIYKPVCGRNGSDTRTFPNACQAANDGYDVIYQSECRGNGGGGIGGAAPGNGPNATGPENGGNAPGAGNGGTAGTDTGKAAGGQSSGNLTAQQPGGGQSCSRAFVPVCGKKGSEKKTFINACMAQSQGYSVADQGRCQ